MKYSDLVSFEPVDTVKVLGEADDRAHAEEDCRTFVFSDSMVQQLEGVFVPNLQVDEATDQKGLLLIANYGTGKTHLMSVISSVAEDAKLLELLTRQEARDALEPVAGRFKVIRAEIGATELSLRDIVMKHFLKKGLERVGVKVKEPKEAPNNMEIIQDWMAAFEEKHGDAGLLLVLDELLDYLRGRRDHELTQDLAFLREVGHVIGSTRFRIIAGLQEALFDNPRFSNVSDTIRRVKARYEQVRISREDVAYVVKERLLKKNTEQRDQIRAHLQQFTPLYEGMAERLDEFVSLFPVHPSFLDVFQAMTLVEKREILKTLSKEIAARLNNDVPEDLPGLVCYDAYRTQLSEDPSNRAIPDIKEVLDKGQVLRTRTERTMATKQYLETALRIIDALMVHRLTTDDINVPIGPTRQELKDDLCLLPPNLPERDATFLETTVASVVSEIMKAVSGQFISENPENGQIYLDVKKDIDYDQQIEERVSHLDDFKLDEAYFKALEEVLDVRESPYVSGYRIWAYELEWPGHGVTRQGYLFMGAPNERSTAQPPRDFYVYFLQPYAPPEFKDERKPDEVFFRLTSPDEEFTSALRRYAGAIALAQDSTATHRPVYEDKAKRALQSMVTWLRTNMHEAVTVTYEGDGRPMGTWLSGPGPRASVKDQMDTIASNALSNHFAARYPDYPKFTTSVPIGKENLEATVQQALVQIATGRATALSRKVLEALELVDVKGGLTDDGRFSQALLESLKAVGGKVLNRAELLEERDAGVWSWPPWHLEPAWLVVAAAALTQQGRSEIGISGSQIDALALDRIAKMGIEELGAFSHIAPPKTLPILQLREVATLLGIAEGTIPDRGVSPEHVTQILDKTESMLGRVVDAQTKIQDGLVLWGAPVVERIDERDRRLGSLKKILENVKARNTVGKLNKLDLEPDQLSEAKKGKAELVWIDAASAAREALASSVEYLIAAVGVFGEDHDLSKEAEALRTEILAPFRRDESPSARQLSELRAAGEDLRKRFKEEAARAHARDRLDAQGDERKRQILEGATFKNLNTLTTVNLLPDGAFGSLRSRLAQIQTCKMFDESKLLEKPTCPDCGYRPQVSKGPTAKQEVDNIGDTLSRLLKEWEQTLLDNLRADEMKEQIELLGPKEKGEVQGFLDAGKLPDEVDSTLAKGLNQVFNKFDVRRIAVEEVWKALFPEQAPATPTELRERFEKFVEGQVGKAPSEKIRFIPKGEEEQ